MKQTRVPGRTVVGSRVNFDALGLQLGGDRVDAGDRQPEMVEALVRRRRRRVDAVAGLDRGDEDVGAADLQVDARRALLHGADHFGAQHLLEPLRGRLRIGAAQMDVVPGEFGHDGSSLSRQWPNVRTCRRVTPIANMHAVLTPDKVAAFPRCAIRRAPPQNHPACDAAPQSRRSPSSVNAICNTTTEALFAGAMQRHLADPVADRAGGDHRRHQRHEAPDGKADEAEGDDLGDVRDRHQRAHGGDVDAAVGRGAGDERREQRAGRADEHAEERGRKAEHRETAARRRRSGRGSASRSPAG